MLVVSIGVGLAFPAGSVGASGAHAARIAGIPIAAPARSPPRFRRFRLVISCVLRIRSMSTAPHPSPSRPALPAGYPCRERLRKSTTLRVGLCGATGPRSDRAREAVHEREDASPGVAAGVRVFRHLPI